MLVFEAIGTKWKIDASTEIDAATEVAIKKRIGEFDRAYSRFRSDSLVTQMSQKAGEYRLPEDAGPMMKLYREMYDLTGGLMTPLVGQVLVDAGYDAQYSLRPKAAIAKAPAWDGVMEYDADQNVLVIKKPVVLDFGAIGKGYLIDIVAGILHERGVVGYTIDAGGDIVTTKPLKVALEDPADAKLALGVASIDNQSICGSAGNRRAWDRFHHIINPNSVESPRHIAALWTVAKTTLLADALSTALFFIGPEKLKAKYDFGFAIVFADRSAVVSKGFPGSLFSES